jgi:hypothetical protein
MNNVKRSFLLLRTSTSSCTTILFGYSLRSSGIRDIDRQAMQFGQTELRRASNKWQWNSKEKVCICIYIVVLHDIYIESNHIFLLSVVSNYYLLMKAEVNYPNGCVQSAKTLYSKAITCEKLHRLSYDKSLVSNGNVVELHIIF